MALVVEDAGHQGLLATVGSHAWGAWLDLNGERVAVLNGPVCCAGSVTDTWGPVGSWLPLRGVAAPGTPSAMVDAAARLAAIWTNMMVSRYVVRMEISENHLDFRLEHSTA